MARRKKNRKKQEEVLVDIVEARDQAQDFLDRNQKSIFGVLTAIVVLIGGLLAYNNFFKKPRQEKAVAQLFQAEYQFSRDSFALSLTNPGGGYNGILDAIESYGGTNSANAANYYAAVSYLNLGKFDAAIAYLEDFDAAGQVMPIMKNGVLGDAWSEKNDFDKALSYYKKAASIQENETLTPYYLKKLGMLHEKLGNFAEAQKMYEKIKNKYSNSPDGRDIDKYLIRIKSKV